MYNLLAVSWKTFKSKASLFNRSSLTWGVDEHLHPTALCGCYSLLMYQTDLVYRDHFGYAPSQCETTLQCNVVSHWLSPHIKWCLVYLFSLKNSFMKTVSLKYGRIWSLYLTPCTKYLLQMWIISLARFNGVIEWQFEHDHILNITWYIYRYVYSTVVLRFFVRIAVVCTYMN